MPTDPAPLDDGDRFLMRECPFVQFVPNRPASRMAAARLKRIRSLTVKGWLHGKVLERFGGGTRQGRPVDGYNCEVTLTRAGRVALGLPPEPPVP